MRIKKGDKVVVIAGSNKGKEGTVSTVLAKENKVVVTGVNVRKKHVKPSQAQPEGKIVEKEAPIHISNVALVDPKTNKPTKVGYKIENGKKVRVAKKSATTIA
jgi:large subunit ribosomal protein L24